MRFHLSSLVSTLATLCALGACVESTSYTPEPPSMPAPRLPMNNAYVGSVHTGPLRPLFRWEPATSNASGTISYQLQLSSDSTFETGLISIETAETSYQPEKDLPVSRTAPVGTRYFWRLRSCLRGACSEYSRTWYVNLGRVIKDYNGDGYSDVAVGAPGNDSLSSNAGRVFLYFGGPNNVLDSTVDGVIITIAEAHPEQRAGENLRSAGDINGDGCADLILGVPGISSAPIGHAYVYYGGVGNTFDIFTDSVLTDSVSDGNFGSGVGSVGDVNGDGADDLFVASGPDNSPFTKIDVFLGIAGARIDARSDGLLQTPRASSIRSAGDVNGDGLADMIVGAMFDSTGGDNAGSAFLYLGTTESPLDMMSDETLIGRGAYDGYGRGVASGGDLNGDGFSDLLVGNHKDEDSGAGQSGSVDVLLGGAGTFDKVVDATLTGTTSNDAFGETIEGVGDVNGDGYGDIVVGASHANAGGRLDSGTAYLYFGGAGSSFDAQPEAIFEGITAGSWMGQRVSGGDLNGDGLGDVTITSYGYDSDRGRVDFYLGMEGVNFRAVPSSTLLGPATGDYFGAGLAMSPRTPSRRRLARGSMAEYRNAGTMFCSVRRLL